MNLGLWTLTALVAANAAVVIVGWVFAKRHPDRARTTVPPGHPRYRRAGR